MTKMAKLLVAAALVACGAAWGGPNTATVGGITWTYTVSGGQATVGDDWTLPLAVANTTEGGIAIPSTLGGYPVTRIGECAFNRCSGLTSVEIPSSVTSIGTFAFCGCSGLTLVEIPSSVTRIGDYVFEGCGGLTSVTIAEGVTSIGTGAFHGCSGLTSVTIPSSMTSIGDLAFEGCGGLASVTIAEGVTSIGEGMFYGCSGLTAVTIPSSVTSIGSSAFYGCSGLTSVTIPPNVTSIGWGAFYGCDGLTTVCVSLGDADRVAWMLEESGEDVGSLDFVETGAATIRTVTFDLGGHGVRTGGGALSQVVTNGCAAIAPLVTAEAGWTFDGWSCDFGCVTNDLVVAAMYSQKKVLADGIYTQTVDGVAWTFRISEGEATVGCGWPSLPAVAETTTGAVAIPPTLGGCPVTSIGDYAFCDCKGLTSVTIPSSVTDIGEWSFRGCSGLTSVEIPSSVTSIGDEAFYGCSGLTSFVVDSQNPYYQSVNGLLLSKDGKSVIAGVNGDVVIPSSVNSIGWGAFYGCGGLTSVEIPSSVTSIGTFAFYGCSGLTSVVIPSSVTSIGARAFDGCSGLTGVTIPSSVTSIGSSAFSGCSGLTAVTIPSSVTSIGSSAFSGCSGLMNITFGGNAPTVGWRSLDGVASGCTATVYEGTTGWGSSGTWNGLTLVWRPNPIPDLGENATREQVAEALAGSADAKLANSITNAAQYAAYLAWAQKVKVADIQAVKDAPNAWLSFALGSETLIAKEPEEGDVKVEAFEPAADGSFAFTVGVKDIEVGADAAAENLKRVFGIEGGTSLEGLSPDGIAIEFGTPENGKVKFTARPKAEGQSAYFMRVNLKP